MSSGSYVEGVFLFKRKVVSQNNDLYRDTTQQTFLSQTLTIFTAQIVHSHICIEERYVYLHSLADRNVPFAKNVLNETGPALSRLLRKGPRAVPTNLHKLTVHFLSKLLM